MISLEKTEDLLKKIADSEKFQRSLAVEAALEYVASSDPEHQKKANDHLMREEVWRNARQLVQTARAESK